jgi:hypothetical protein
MTSSIKANKAGWGCVSAIDSRGRTIFVVDAHRGNGKRFIVRADEKGLIDLCARDLYEGLRNYRGNDHAAKTIPTPPVARARMTIIASQAKPAAQWPL